MPAKCRLKPVSGVEEETEELTEELSEEELAALPPFAQFGRITVRQRNRYNWLVSGDGRMRYYPTLGSAIQRAAVVAADDAAKDAADWLLQFKKIAARIARLAGEVERANGPTQGNSR